MKLSSFPDKWFIYGLITFFPLYVFSQEKPTDFKHGFYLTPGIPSLSVSYEHLLINKIENRKFYTRAIAGKFVDVINGQWSTYLASMNSWVYGSEKNHLEVGLGLALITPFNSPELWGAAILGYRYQKPGDNFIFRTGASIPEGVYVSFGRAF